MAKIRYRLNRSDVAISSIEGGRMPGHYVLLHKPTGIQVSGDAVQPDRPRGPAGLHSRRQMANLRQQTLGQLWDQLENEVKAALRLPGR